VQDPFQLLPIYSDKNLEWRTYSFNGDTLVMIEKFEGESINLAFIKVTLHTHQIKIEEYFKLIGIRGVDFID